MKHSANPRGTCPTGSSTMSLRNSRLFSSVTMSCRTFGKSDKGGIHTRQAHLSWIFVYSLYIHTEMGYRISIRWAHFNLNITFY